MEAVSAETISICLAGDYDTARHICRQWTVANPRCVTVQRASYVYEFGEEEGVIVTFRSYPRFPPAPGELQQLAESLCHALMTGLCQRTAMICTPTRHYWVKRT